MQLSQECAGRCAQDGSEHRERSRNDSGWCMGAVHRRFKVQPLLLLNAAPQHDSAHAPAETHWLPTLVPQLRWIVRWKSSEHLRAQQHHHNGAHPHLKAPAKRNPAWAFDLKTSVAQKWA